ncbi:alpha/beta hydrolase family protein [Peristeroidobacter soli]|jgi:dipeptidyl aminopeptidase/acylaminoacyl peptidase|uniref:alpha/beta hydrolase family protein n=1 Tax=Peristeroidobacter soli TaxID=2497877 RepID=UPI0013005700|nr:prolyl oligopeptidase family serine peptidase [Peristeroidobacter soli]
MKAARRVAAAALLCAVSVGSIARPFTVDDALRMEEIGPGAFTPSGDALVFVQAPPLEEFPDFGMMIIPGPRFGHLMSVETNGDATTRPLLPIDPAAVRALINLSPDGRYVAYLEAKEGELRLGAVDRETGESRLSEALPELNYIHNLTPIWAGDSKLLFAARAPGSLPPFIPYLRRATGEKLAAEWRKAWSGTEVSASVYRSRRDGGSSPPLSGRLVAFDVRDGSTATWAEGLFSDLRLAPGGRHVVAIQQFEKPQMPVDGLGNNWVPGRGRLALFETATTRRIDVDARLDAMPGTVEWSADGRRLGFFAWHDEEDSQSGVFRTFDVASHRLQSLPHTGLDLVNEREFGPPAKPMRFVWIGADIAVPARPNPPGVSQPRFSNRGVTGRDLNVDPGRFDWYWLSASQAPRNLTARFGAISPWAAGNSFIVLENRIHKLDARGRVRTAFANIEIETAPLASNAARSREPFESRVVYSEKTTGSLVTFDLERGTVKRVELRDGRPEAVAISMAGDMVAYRKVQPRGTELVLHLPRDREQVVAKINGLLADIDLPTNQRIKYPGAGGEVVTSCLTLPPQAKSGQRLPTMVYVYPSSRPRCPDVPDLQGFTYENRAPLVSHGYALLNVAAPMVATPEGGPLDGVVAAVDRAIDAAVQTGYVDPERLAVVGASGAGFTGVWLAGHSTRFKAIVSINGIANIQSHYFGIGVADLFYPAVSSWQGGATRYESLDQFGLGFSPWDDPAYYWKISPIAYARQVQTPILLVSTDMDVGGFSQQYDDMFVALKRQRKEVDYVKYWGEGHGPMSPANVRDLTRRTLEWLDKYLSPAPERRVTSG